MLIIARVLNWVVTPKLLFECCRARSILIWHSDSQTCISSDSLSANQRNFATHISGFRTKSDRGLVFPVPSQQCSSRFLSSIAQFRVFLERFGAFWAHLKRFWWVWSHFEQTFSNLNMLPEPSNGDGIKSILDNARAKFHFTLRSDLHIQWRLTSAVMGMYSPSPVWLFCIPIALFTSHLLHNLLSLCVVNCRLFRNNC